MTPQNNQKFLEKLQEEARLQAKLNTRRFLPQQLDTLTSFVGNYPWQVILTASGLTALAIELMTRIVL